MKFSAAVTVVRSVKGFMYGINKAYMISYILFLHRRPGTLLAGAGRYHGSTCTL